MKRLPNLLLLGTLLLVPSWPAPAAAQSSRTAPGLSLAQAERNAVDLKQGMSAEEVERLLGKPRRTALKGSGSSSIPSQAALQWTYNWSSASTPAILHVEFTAKTSEAWLVNGWEWVSF